MTLQTQHTVDAPAIMTDEQRQHVADALESAQSENTRQNYTGQFRKFSAWCEREVQSALPAQPEVVAAYAAELADEGKSMFTMYILVTFPQSLDRLYRKVTGGTVFNRHVQAVEPPSRYIIAPPITDGDLGAD